MFLLYVQVDVYRNILKLRCWSLTSTSYKAFLKKQAEVWNHWNWPRSWTRSCMFGFACSSYISLNCAWFFCTYCDHTPWNSWKVVEFNFCLGNNWKLLEFQHFLENVLECPGILWKYSQKKILFMNEIIISLLHCISSILILFYLKKIKI